MALPGKAQTPAPKIRLVLVDDQPIVRKGMALLFGMEPDLLVCGEAESEPEAFERISALKPDLAVVDLSLKEGTGLNLIKRVRQRCPEVKLLVFSTSDQPRDVAHAFAAGAQGYVTKDEGAKELLGAIRLVMSGKSFLSKALAAADVKPPKAI